MNERMTKRDTDGQAMMDCMINLEAQALGQETDFCSHGERREE